MSNYRRFHVTGGTYFFTLALADRRRHLLTDHADLLRAAFAETLREHPVVFDAIVVLPDHLHAVWTLPPGDSAYSERWRKIKRHFSRAIALHLPRSASKRRKRETGIWQRRFWEHAIRDQNDYRRHVEYCWGNPVKHGLVQRPVDWPHSSIHRDIRRGMVESAWVGDAIDVEAGEPGWGSVSG